MQQIGNYKLNKIIIVSILLFASSCKRFVEVPPPPNVVTVDKVFTDDNKAISTINGLYAFMINNGAPSFSTKFITTTCGFAADEFLIYTPKPDDIEAIQNQFLPKNEYTNRIWTTAYQTIYYANAIMEGLANSLSVTSQVKQQLTGECSFVRAFCYFYLANLYGDVPLITTTDYRINAIMPRTPRAEVYQQMITDLTKAKEMMSDVIPPQGSRSRPNKWAAVALLARIYLYNGNWAKAEAESSAVIGSGGYTPLPALDKVFPKPAGTPATPSSEAIWQLHQRDPRPPEFNEAFRVLTGGPPNMYFRPTVLAWFEPKDARRNAWVDSVVYGTPAVKYYIPGKYKNPTTPGFNYMVLRAAEQYLIRAEARVKQNNLPGSLEDLNVIRVRAKLDSLSPSLTQAQILAAIEQERRVELFAEWGNRWLDLKRYGRADAVLSLIKGSSWQISTDTLWPIPEREILANINLTQNPGY